MLFALRLNVVAVLPDSNITLDKVFVDPTAANSTSTLASPSRVTVIGEAA